MLGYQEIKKLKLHDPFITGNNLSYYVTGYIPQGEFKKVLPKNMAIPSDEVLARAYPTIKKIKGMHPCLLMFSRCYNVHDIITQLDLRPYLELLFYFPVIYKDMKEERLCSYLPVLYLDFLLGTLGGLFLGLRKEFHPGLTYSETDTSNSFIIKDILTTNFQRKSMEPKLALDPFFVDVFKKPTVTVSYLNKTVFYTTTVQPKKIFRCSADYQWNYKGSLIQSDENTFANYCEYDFSTSWAMNYKKYFHPDYSMKGLEDNSIKVE